MSLQTILAILFLGFSLSASPQGGNELTGGEARAEVMLVQIWKGGGVAGVFLTTVNADGTKNETKVSLKEHMIELVRLLNQLSAEGWQVTSSNGGDIYSTYVLTRIGHNSPR